MTCVPRMIVRDGFKLGIEDGTGSALDSKSILNTKSLFRTYNRV